MVTGGTQGLGLAIAKKLKEQGALVVFLVGRSREKGEEAITQLREAYPPIQEDQAGWTSAYFIQADLKNAEETDNVFKTVQVVLDMMKNGGLPDGSEEQVTGLVNCAATTSRGNLFSETADGFDEHMAVNARAPFLLTQAFANHLKKASAAKKINVRALRGTVVNISSCAAHGGAPFIMAYSASKAALNVLTKNNAAELAPLGIRVNAINMGWCLTDNEDALQSKKDGPAWIEKADQSVPLGRILRPEDTASTAVFLLSGLSTMMTGSIIDLHPEYPHGMLSLLDSDSR